MTKAALCATSTRIHEPVVSEPQIVQPTPQRDGSKWGHYPSADRSPCENVWDGHLPSNAQNWREQLGYEAAFQEVEQLMLARMAGIMGTSSRIEISTKIGSVIAALITKKGPAQFEGLAQQLEKLSNALKNPAAREEIQTQFKLFVSKLKELVEAKAIGPGARGQLEKHVGSIRQLEGLE